MPTEYETTIAAVANTAQMYGLTQAQFDEDRRFIAEVFMLIGKSSDPGNDHDLHPVLDCALIGLTYHRHVPFIDAHDERLRRPARHDADYAATLHACVDALKDQVGVPRPLIERALEDGFSLAVTHLRPPESFDSEGVTLHSHVVTLMMLGMCIHRLMPITHKKPERN